MLILAFGCIQSRQVVLELARFPVIIGKGRSPLHEM